MANFQPMRNMKRSLPHPREGRQTTVFLAKPELSTRASEGASLAHHLASGKARYTRAGCASAHS
eukprot:587895-Alexandrium_andersonii.AAC.1